MSDWMFKYWSTITLICYIFSFLTLIWIACLRKEKWGQKLLLALIVFAIPIIGGFVYWIIYFGEKVYRKYFKKSKEQEKTVPEVPKTESCQTIEALEQSEKIDFETFRVLVHNTDFYQKILRILDYYESFNDYEEHFDNVDKMQMLHAIDFNMDNYTVRLKKEYPQLSDNDVCFLAYYILALKVSEIAVVIERNRSTIYRMESRILKKLNTVGDIQTVLENIQ